MKQNKRLLLVKSKEELVQEILDKDDLIEAQLLRIQELENRLNRNSQNSNQPSSTDQYEKQRKPQSNREKTNKKTGGQIGHNGTTLSIVKNPDVIENHDIIQCTSCAHDLSEVQASTYINKQECDIPIVKPVITEHRMALKTCPSCKSLNTAKAPNGLTQAIQYGTNIKALISYLHYEQLVPVQRIKETIGDLYNLEISEGTIVNMHENLDSQLQNSSEQIALTIQESSVINNDESSLRVKGQTYWMHSASTDLATMYYIHKKRGCDAMDAMNILPKHNGIKVHDHWAPYFKYGDLHALCNAHHLRELCGIFENYKQQWAQDMKEHLLLILQTIKQHKIEQKTELSDKLLKQLSDKYDAILLSAVTQIPTLVQLKAKSRGRIKQHPAKNLYDRLLNKKQETLRFMHDFRVPFTNNLAERDIRMIKVKQKISGCFRSAEGANRFCRIRGYISTSRKRNLNIFTSLENAIRGQPSIFSS